jgi:hypothetical protein
MEFMQNVLPYDLPTTLCRFIEACQRPDDRNQTPQTWQFLPQKAAPAQPASPFTQKRCEQKFITISLLLLFFAVNLFLVVVIVVYHQSLTPSKIRV